MKRLTTDTPKNNTQSFLNLVSAKDGHVWLRWAGEDGGDMNLYDYMRRHKEGWENYSNEDIANIMCDEICEPLDLLYWLAVGFTENRARLKEFEDLIESPEEIETLQSRIKESEGERDKAVKRLKVIGNCSECKHRGTGIDWSDPQRKAVGICAECRTVYSRWEFAGLEGDHGTVERN